MCMQYQGHHAKSFGPPCLNPPTPSLNFRRATRAYDRLLKRHSARPDYGRAPALREVELAVADLACRARPDPRGDPPAWKLMGLVEHLPASRGQLCGRLTLCRGDGAIRHAWRVLEGTAARLAARARVGTGIDANWQRSTPRMIQSGDAPGRDGTTEPPVSTLP